MKKKTENTEIQSEGKRPDAGSEAACEVNTNTGSEEIGSAGADAESEASAPAGADAERDQVEPSDRDVQSDDTNVDEEDETEKLLFRDTTPELVTSAVSSLNQQGLLSVQYREEEGTYAVYASPEEFERARELLIEILKDEADSIRERARTLEAKKTLRIMESTELAPGFKPEKTPKEKYEDANSTAIAFLVVGGIGLVFLLFEYFGIFFSLGLTGTVRYIFYPTMLVMFGAFLAVGFASMNSAAKWKVKMFEETRIMNNVREYVEHDLIHEIRTLMADRVVRETEEESTAAAARPNAEDALLQLTSMLEGGFTGEESLEEAELAVRESPKTDETPEADELSETDETPDTDDMPDQSEMENVFNDYYVMEHEIQLRLLKEFPDLPANLMLEATEYVISLLEENFADEENAAGMDDNTEEDNTEEDNLEEYNTEETNG